MNIECSICLPLLLAITVAISIDWVTQSDLVESYFSHCRELIKRQGQESIGPRKTRQETKKTETEE